MQPASGDVYRLREELIGDAKIGDRIDTDALRAQMREIVDATSHEIAAAEQDQLVRVGEPAARKLMLGDREQQRRRKRRKRR
jgi:hypothetical protein